MQCNLCWAPLDTGQRHACTPCLHVYCLDCVGKLLDGAMGCHVCSAPLSRTSVKAVQVLQDGAKYKFALCGQTPEVIMQTALTAISFFNQQADLSNQYRENALKNRTQQMHAQFNAKLAQTHGAYQKAKAKVAALAAQKASLEQENNEISTKYQLRSSQVMQLKEQLQVLSGGGPPKAPRSSNQVALMQQHQQHQQQHQQHQQQQQHMGHMGHPHSMGHPHDGMAHGTGSGGNGGLHRASSPVAHGDMTMMTTIRQRQHIFNMHVEDDNAPHLLGGTPSAAGHHRRRRSSAASDMEPMLDGMSPCRALGIGPAMPAGMPRQGNWGIGSPHSGRMNM